MSQTFAIIKTGGKQYKVAEGQKLRVEKLTAEEGSEVVFDSVLMVSSEADLKIGTPVVEGAKVSAKVARQARDRKVIVFKYRAKKRYKKKAGHRQAFTELEITKISA